MRNENFVMPFYKYRIGCDIDIGGEKSDERVDIVLTSERGNPEERENIYEYSPEEYRVLSPIATYYIYPKENSIRPGTPGKLGAIVCLRRSGECAEIVRIDAGTARFGALLNNCVGAAFLPPYILKSIIRSDYFAKLLECVPILELTLPDSFEFLRDGYGDIAEMIRTYII